MPTAPATQTYDRRLALCAWFQPLDASGVEDLPASVRNELVGLLRLDLEAMEARSLGLTSDHVGNGYAFQLENGLVAWCRVASATKGYDYRQGAVHYLLFRDEAHFRRYTLDAADGKAALWGRLSTAAVAAL